MGKEELQELIKQNERIIMKIDPQLDKLESTGKRTMQYVNYFGRTFMTDRLIICLALLIVAGVVATIVILCI